MALVQIDLEKLQNAYWRMDDALDEMKLTSVHVMEAWDAHKLLWQIIEPFNEDGVRSGDDPSPANNND